LESQQPEHFISLPVVHKSEESARLPLVINVIAKYWGKDIIQETTREQASTKGTLLIEGIELAESQGFVCNFYKGSIKDLKKRVDQGIPPIVIMPGIQGTAQHATIVSGYNTDERRILIYVPEPDTVGAIPETKFEQDWEQDDMTVIIIVPSDMKNIFRNDNLTFLESNRICFEAERLRQTGKIEDAVRKLRIAAQTEQANAQVWSLLGGIYNEIGSDEALACYERAIKLNPKYYLAYRGLGNYYLKKSDYLLADKYYTKAISINPIRFGPIYKNRAVARIQLGDNRAAKEDLAKYLEQMPVSEDRKNVEEAIARL
jgi:tetratricopeptide (TPR) repeat protein